MFKNTKKGFLPAWIILCLSLAVTAVIWHNTSSEIKREARQDFDLRAEEIRQRIVRRMLGYEQVLRGGVGLFNASQSVTGEEWREYVSGLKVEKNYPGIQGIGFSAVVHPTGKTAHIEMMRKERRSSYSVWPDGSRAMYTSIIYLEPLDWRNQRAIGYDMYSEPVRRTAMDKAVELDMAAISGKVRLVQETEKDVQAGFLMYLPVYRKGLPVGSQAQRREALQGYVYAPFRMADFMQRIIGRDVPDLDVEVFDGEAISEPGLMYDSDSSRQDFQRTGQAQFKKTVRLELNGSVWTLYFSSLPAFENAIDREKPVIVLAAGMVISFLFSAIAFFLASNRERLRSINEDLNSEVDERKKAEDGLRKAHGALETRVEERTRELTTANEALQREIAVRTRAESAFKESEERLRALVETTNDWVWEMDTDFRYTYASPMITSMLGYSTGEVLGTTPFDRMDAGDGARLRAALEGFAASKSPFTIETTGLKKDGSAAVVETSGAPIIGSRGEFLGYRGVDRDATGRKRLEEERMNMHSQLLQTQKMELLGRLAGGVAHDFNNILGIITSLNSLAIKEARSGEVRDYLGQIQSASERAANLTRQLLIFSRNQPTETAPMDLNRTIREMLSLMRSIMGENITISTELAPDLMTIEADATNIEQVLMNLIVNSREAMPGRGEITIKSSNVTIDGAHGPGLAPGEYVSVIVSDSGAGMDEETLGHIFEPFFSTKEPGKGIGLGLTVVNNIVREYRGAATVESRPGMGTAFKVLLPASRAKVVPEPPRPTGEPAGRGERILLVEDEPMLSRSVALVLAKSGYSVFTARDAVEAEGIFGQEGAGVDLVFSDVVLKGKSGVSVVDEFLAKKPGLKVVFASGYMDIDAEWPYIKESGFRFLQKPYEIPELLKTIRDSLDGSPGAHGAGGLSS